MFEVELKAHVNNWDDVENKLKEIGSFISHVQRNDTYYKMTRNDGTSIQVRIREEIDFTNNKKRLFMTYKNKEMKKSHDGTDFEVNEEKECEISDKTAMESLFFATGFSIDATKIKGVYDYEVDGVLCELCTVPPLGDFLEMEILLDEMETESNPVLIDNARERLEKTLEKAGISKDNIEKRYYNDMLKENSPEI